MDDTQHYTVLPLVYQGQEVRTYRDHEGIIWWVAIDVGAVLGISRVHTTLGLFPADEKGVHTMYTPGGPQQVATLNEPGLYRLIFQSRKPEAEAFKRWVFHEVLPTLRRTGSYTAPKVPAREMPARVTTSKVEVSLHLAKIWRLLRTADGWLSNHELAHHAAVAPRTARAHMRYLLDIGLLERQEVFPRHLYRLCVEAERQHLRAWQHLDSCSTLLLERARY